MDSTNLLILKEKLKRKIDVINTLTDFSKNFVDSLYSFSEIVFDTSIFEEKIKEVKKQQEEKLKPFSVKMQKVKELIQNEILGLGEKLTNLGIHDEKLKRLIPQCKDSCVVIVSLNTQIQNLKELVIAIRSRLIEIHADDLSDEFKIEEEIPTENEVPLRFGYYVENKISDLFNEYRVNHEKYSDNSDYSFSSLHDVYIAIKSHYSGDRSALYDDFISSSHTFLVEWSKFLKTGEWSGNKEKWVEYHKILCNKIYDILLDYLSTKLASKNDERKIPFFIGDKEHIYQLGKTDPILEKAGNKAYWFIRGCIEKCNEDNTIDVSSIYLYLLENNNCLQERFKIKSKMTSDKQWKLIHNTYYNIKRDYIKNLDTFLIKNQKQINNLQWL